MKPALEAIARNISKFGHHLYLIAGAASPRFAYTIGLGETLGFELVLAGAAFYDTDAVKRIVNAIASRLRGGDPLGTLFEVESLDPSVSERVALIGFAR